MEVLKVRQNLDFCQALKANRDMLTWLVDESLKFNVSRECFVDVLTSVHSNLAIILDTFEDFYDESKDCK